MDKKIISIALDGPAGAGKSTTADDVAARLGILHLDTGALYRACALACLEADLNRGDTEAILALMDETDIDVAFVDGTQSTLLNGLAVNSKIRTPEVSLWASDVSAIPEVRLKLLDLQRDLAKEMSLVIDGRDIGSYVLPDADIKIYLDAKPEVRAKRRLRELQIKDPNITYEEVYEDMIYRDKQDSAREIAPLVIPEDAYVIDTSEHSISDTTEVIIAYINSKFS